MEERAREEEQTLETAKISKASILMIWLSVPCFLGVGVGGIYSWIMRLLKAARSLDEGVFGFIRGVLIFVIVLLALIWTAVAVVLTKRNLRYSLTYNDRRVVATAGKERLESEISELKNVYLEDSLLGNIFHYGAITIQTERGSITVKNICDPDLIKKKLLDRMNEFQEQ